MNACVVSAILKFFLSPKKSKKKSFLHITTIWKRHFDVKQKIDNFFKEILRPDHLSTSTRCTLECCTRWSRGINHVIKGQAWTCELELQTWHFFQKLVIVVQNELVMTAQEKVIWIRTNPGPVLWINWVFYSEQGPNHEGYVNVDPYCYLN